MYCQLREVSGFQFEPEKMRQVTYEFKYWVLLECFRAKNPDLLVKEDPFTEWPEDANVRMEASQLLTTTLIPRTRFLHYNFVYREINCFASYVILEIVCIPNPDGEDEGGQASSFLAVFTR
ncbi:hypothetical protein BHE74_00031513 [Ensete ventricosum]|nr:hypothetical protein BHE74_00031513 [Ensete ventricosum]